MAMTREYLDLVENAIDIAPVGSQEEVQASEFMLDAFTEHDLETEIQDFSAPLYGRLFTGIVLLVAVLGAVFSGIGGFGWAALGFLLALAAGAYLASEYLGMDFTANIGPSAESQNVVGIHRGEGARAGRGVRPIVVLARYDTGREELLAKPGLISIAPLVWQVAPWCLAVVVVGALLQLLQIIGGPALIVLWIITMVCALPLLLLGLNEITSCFLSLTDGANDNKAALAAMLGVLEDVVPTDEERLKARARLLIQARAQERREEDDVVEYEEYDEEELEPVLGVRHGKKVLKDIGMLPPTCEVEYVAPKVIVSRKRRAKPVPDEGVVSFSGVISDHAIEGEEAVAAEDIAGSAEAGSAGPVAAGEGGAQILEFPHAGQTAALAPEPSPEGVSRGGDLAADEKWGEAEFAPGVSKRRALLFDLPDPAIESSDPLDSSVDMDLQDTTQVVGADLEAAAVQTDAGDVVGAAVEAADGGRGLFSRLSKRGGERGSSRGGRRSRSRKGRNAEVVDELIEETFDEPSGDDWMGGAARSGRARRAMAAITENYFAAQDADSGYPDAPDARSRRMEELREEGLDEDVIAGELDLEAEKEADVTGEQEALESLDHPEREDDEEPVPSDLDVIGAPADEKLRQAVLDMGDVNLVSHDIWFVCVGASSLRHMGTQEFVNAHRRELRGCFIINLDSVGAGNLTLLTTEGYGDTRKGDRKISRLFDTASKALRVPLSMSEHNWEDTDVTPALRRSMRGVTLMGTEGGRMRALANTPDDVLENIDANQVVYAAELVSEVIRRA